MGFGGTPVVVGGATIAGFFAAACSLPFDYVKTQMQKMKPDPITGEVPYKVRGSGEEERRWDINASSPCMLRWPALRTPGHPLSPLLPPLHLCHCHNSARLYPLRGSPGSTRVMHASPPMCQHGPPKARLHGPYVNCHKFCACLFRAPWTAP